MSRVIGNLSGFLNARIFNRKYWFSKLITLLCEKLTACFFFLLVWSNVVCLYIQNAINNLEALKDCGKENISVTTSNILGRKFCVLKEK